MKADEAGIVISGRSWSASDFVRADGTPGPWTSKALEADPLSFEAELFARRSRNGAHQRIDGRSQGFRSRKKPHAGERSGHHRVFGA